MTPDDSTNDRLYVPARSPSIYTDPLAAGTEFFSEFVELSHKALAKLKFRVLNNILSVACRVASCKPPKPAFVVHVSPYLFTLSQSGSLHQPRAKSLGSVVATVKRGGAP